MVNNKFENASKTSEKFLVSRYLPGFYKSNIPLWPFIGMGIVIACFIGITINHDLGFKPALIPIGIIAAFVAVLIVQKPEIGAYILIFSTFSSLSDILFDRGYPGINRPLIALTIGSVLINYFLKTGKYNRFPKLSASEWTLIVFYITMIVTVIAVPEKSGAFDTIIDITKDILVGVCIYITLNTQERWKSGVLTLIITMVFLSILGVIKTVTGTEATFFDLARNSLFGQVGSANELRYGGPIGEPNLWGQALVSILPLIVYATRFRHSIKNMILLALGGLLILLAMIFTGSRGAMVAFLLITPLIAIDIKIKPKNLIVAVIFFFALLAVLPENYANRFKTLTSQDALAEDGALSGRQTAMLIGLEMFRDNPILGVGFGGYRINYWQYAEKLGLESNATNIVHELDAKYSHSLYIEILSETGLVGMIAFLFFFGTMFKSLYNIRKRINAAVIYKEWSLWIAALTISIFTFLVSGFFLHGIFYRYIWVIIGLAMSAISIFENIRPVPYYNHNKQARKFIR